MQENSSVFRVPSFAKCEAYDFEATKDTLEVYQELTAISEEIEECRSKHC